MTIDVADHTRTAQQALLLTPVGQTGSGGLRYAAAMYFYQNGLMAADMLEIYRRCCKFDREDPIDVARYEGIEPPRFDRLLSAAVAG